MRLFFLFSVCMLIIIHACQKEAVPPHEKGVSKVLAQYRKSLVRNLHYSLHFSIPADETQPIPGRETLRFNLREGFGDIPLDFRVPEEYLDSIRINGHITAARIDNEHIVLPEGMLKAGENSVEIQFTTGETSLNRNPDYLYTLFVPDRARTAFPVFDQPDLKAVFELTLDIPVGWTALSNAPVVSKREHHSVQTITFAPSDRISSYLFSFVAGKFKQITRKTDSFKMTMLHRETDQEKVARNQDDIFKLHETSLKWLEAYTGIPFPFQKFDFVLIPSFQYGGMEHVGAIQYNASRLLLDENPSSSRLLNRASLIAHETAHMWFGNLVTMEWFNDVWTKEVFANFMAAKIMNPNYPEINHDLNFLLRHHPSAYAVDRTKGANPIRQKLNNLNEAGQMYGAIIYNKAPIMMQQLELLIGKEAFKKGIQQYLEAFSFSNATWPDLIGILDDKSEIDLETWSKIWVNTAGRPQFKIQHAGEKLIIEQHDRAGKGRVWPQKFDIVQLKKGRTELHQVEMNQSVLGIEWTAGEDYIILNTNGKGYGLFPARVEDLKTWNRLNDVAKGSLIINLYESMLAQHEVEPLDYYKALQELLELETNQLLLNEIISQIKTIYWDLLPATQRRKVGPELEKRLWERVTNEKNSAKTKLFFNAFQSVAVSEPQVERLYKIWNRELELEGLNLSESDYTQLAGALCIRRPQQAENIIQNQMQRINNSDRKRRFEFIKPALSASQQERDQFFESLKKEENRQTESWVLAAVGYLHHPMRVKQSEKYILPSLQLLQEIQVTGDIFFPKRWLDQTLQHHSTDYAVQQIRTFLEQHPDYNKQLRMKILQAADMVFRANQIKQIGGELQ